MGCNCKNNSNNCNSCPTETCGCKMNLSALCVVYQGGNLDTLGITEGDRLEIILGDIDNYLSYLNDLIISGFIGINVGGGVELYKGLNSDDLGELRTFVDSPSVTVANTADTISFEVSQTWIDAIINPILSDIIQINTSITNLQNSFTTLQGNVSTNTANIVSILNDINSIEGDINTIQNDITNIQGDIIDVQQDIIDIQGDVNNNSVDINQNTIDIANLQNDLGNITESEVFTEQFQGQQIVALAQDPVQILNVYFEGGVLPSAGWVFQAPNQVALQLAAFGLTVEATDIVRVEYKK